MGYTLTKINGIWTLSWLGKYTGYEFKIKLDSFADLEKAISVCGIRAMYFDIMNDKYNK